MARARWEGRREAGRGRESDREPERREKDLKHRFPPTDADTPGKDPRNASVQLPQIR